MTSYTRGRICAQPECDTILSIYNPTKYCTVHARLDASERRREASRPIREVTCEQCGTLITTSNQARKYCSDRCRMAAFARRKRAALRAESLHHSMVETHRRHLEPEVRATCQVIEPFSVELVSSSKELVVVAVRGEIDIATAPLFEEVLGQALQSGAAYIAINFDRVEFIDCSVLSVFSRALSQSQDRGATVEIICGSEFIARILSMAGFDRFMTVSGSLADEKTAVSGANALRVVEASLPAAAGQRLAALDQARSVAHCQVRPVALNQASPGSRSTA